MIYTHPKTETLPVATIMAICGTSGGGYDLTLKGGSGTYNAEHAL